MPTLNFDASNVTPLQPLSVLPRGRYEVMITASEMKPTKAGNGSYLQLEFTVIAGDHEGRKLWSRLNLDNQSATAVQIARSELAAICQALGLGGVGDSEELHDQPLQVDVVIEARDGTESNRIKAYLAAGKTTPSAPAAAAKPAPAAQKAMPWAKKPVAA